MNRTRILLTDREIEAAFKTVRTKMYQRLEKKGWYSFIGPHETAGVVQEEVNEMWDEVQNNNNNALEAELVDIAVAAIFAIASRGG